MFVERISETKKAHRTEGTAPVGKKHRRTHGDALSKASRSGFEEGASPADNPLAGATDNGGGTYEYVDPISWMIAILQEMAKNSSELDQALGDTLADQLNALRDSAKMLGEQESNDLMEQSRGMAIGAVAQGVGAAVTLGATGVSLAGTKSAQNDIEKIQKEIDPEVVASKEGAARMDGVTPAREELETVAVGDNSAAADAARGAGAGKAELAEGEEMAAAESADRTREPEKNEKEKTAAELRKIKLQKAQGKQGQWDKIGQLGYVGNGLGQAASGAAQANASAVRADIAKVKAEADGLKQRISIMLQMLQDAFNKTNQAYDQTVSMANQTASTFASSVRN